MQTLKQMKIYAAVVVAMLYGVTKAQEEGIIDEEENTEGLTELPWKKMKATVDGDERKDLYFQGEEWSYTFGDGKRGQIGNNNRAFLHESKERDED